MPRPTMAVLIARMQAELPANALTADQIQDELDRHREDVYRLPLTPVHTTLVGGTIVYLDYYAQAPGGLALGDWEDGEVLQTGRWDPVTADSADRLTGHWTFLADVRPPLYLTGRTFDFWAAAAGLLRTYRKDFARQVDFSTEGQRVNLSQQMSQIADLIRDAERRRRRPNRRAVRNDTPAWA